VFNGEQLIYITSLCSSKDNIKEAVSELINLGYKNIELTGNTKYYPGLEKDIIFLKKKHNLNLLVHNYFPPKSSEFILNLGTGNPDYLKASFNFVRDAIGFSRLLGNKSYSVHCGYHYDVRPGMLEDGSFTKIENTENSKAAFYKTIEKIMSELVGNDFTLAIENLCPRSKTDLYSMINSADDIIEYLEFSQQWKNLGLLLDMSHLNRSSSVLGFDLMKVLNEIFYKYPEKVFEIHLSGGSSFMDSHKVSNENSWHIQYLMSKMPFLNKIPIVFEWQYSANAETFKNYEKILKSFKTII